MSSKQNPLAGAALSVGLLAVSGALMLAAPASAQRLFEDNQYVPWVDPADRTGFEMIFDGKTLDGWAGNPNQWRVENGVIVGQSTEEFPVDSGNTFLVWQDGTPSDFELKLEFRFASEAGNSGVQYRSRMRKEGRNPWALGGYQADMNFENQHTGMLYEEGGRGRLAVRGMVTHIAEDGTKELIGAINSQESLGEVITPMEWNQMHIIARGNTLMHIVNGQVTAVVVDDDVAARSGGGYIGLQLHGGPPMRVEYRNIGIKYR